MHTLKGLQSAAVKQAPLSMTICSTSHTERLTTSQSGLWCSSKLQQFARFHCSFASVWCDNAKQHTSHLSSIMVNTSTVQVPQVLQWHSTTTGFIYCWLSDPRVRYEHLPNDENSDVKIYNRQLHVCLLTDFKKISHMGFTPHAEWWQKTRQ